MASAPKKPCIRPVGPNGKVENWSSTDVKVYKKEFLWVISHYSFQDAKGKHLKSSQFTADFDDKTDCKWYLYLKPKGENNSDDHVALYLHLDPNSQCKNLYAKTKFSIMTEEQKECNSWDSSITEFTITADGPKRISWGCAKYIKRSQLLNVKNNFLPNDKLTIFCEITYSQVIFANTFHQSNSIPIPPALPNNRLSEDFESLLKNRDFADILISANGVNHPVHKTILIARSSVFAAMFKHDNMQESEMKSINITDIEEDELQEMLRYIYTGKVEKLENLAGGLLAAADKYDLAELKIMCVNELLVNLSVESAANTLALADLYRADELKSVTMEFIVSKPNEVMRTEAWKRDVSPNLHLVNEICEALSQRLVSDSDN